MKKFFYKKHIYNIDNLQIKNKIHKLRKKKWKFFKKSLKFRRKRFRIFDHTKYTLSKRRMKFFRNRNLFNLRSKQQLNFYYGFLKKKFIKQIIRKSFTFCKHKKKRINPKNFFLNSLEKMLSVVLVRAYFAKTILMAKQLIKHKKILVNNIVVKSPKYVVRTGDVISVKHNYKINIVKNISFYMSNVMTPPKFYHVNYKILKIIILDNENLVEHRNLNRTKRLQISSIFKFFRQ